MWWLVAAMFPSFRGGVALFFAGLAGWWFGGTVGCYVALGGLLAAAFIRPQASSWLVDTLYACRFVCWAFALMSLAVGGGKLGINPTTLLRGGIFAILGLLPHLRLLAMSGKRLWPSVDRGRGEVAT